MEEIWASLFWRWRGRRCPTVPSGLASVVRRFLDQEGWQASATYRLRNCGFWEVAAMLEDEALQKEAASKLADREKAGWRMLRVGGSGFPPRLFDALGRACPPILWASGDLDSVVAPSVAIVGSRDLSSEERQFAYQAGTAVASLGLAVVSGGARGADSYGVLGALSAKGSGWHILPGGDRLPRPCASAIVSEDPEAVAFDRIMALRRNRLIYASACVAILVSSRFGEGGAWVGALECKRFSRTPLVVYVATSPSSGNLAFSRMGAKAVSSVSELAEVLPSMLLAVPRLAV